MASKVKMSPPDGGWGWMVVMGSALANAFVQSLLSLFGLIFGDKLIEMGEATIGVTTVANSMLLMTTFSGIITGPALKTFSPRQVAIVGSMMASFGLITASFASRMWHLIATYSIFTGLGLGLVQSSTFVAVNQYFRKHRGKAVGMSYAGTGLGQMLMPHLVRYLLDTFDYRKTAIILGTLALNGVIGASFFQPVEKHMIPVIEGQSENDPLLKKKEDNTEDNNQETLRRKSFMSYDNVESDIIKEDGKILKRSYSFPAKKISNDAMEIKTESRTWSKFKSMMDFDLLKDINFISIIVAVSLGFISNQSFNMLFPFFLQQQLLLSREQTANCMSVLAATDIVSRLTFPIFTDMFRISSKISFFVGCLMLGISRTLLAFQVTFMGCFVMSGLGGMFRSLVVVNQNMVISDYCRKFENKLPAALGLNMMMKGVSVMTIGQLLGYIRDVTGSYVTCLLYQNGLYGIVIVMWTPQFIYKFVKRKKLNNNNIDKDNNVNVV